MRGITLAGGRGPDPWKITSYMGFYKGKAIGPPPPPLYKVGPPPPLKNVPPPLEPWQIIVFFETNHWASVK